MWAQASMRLKPVVVKTGSDIGRGAKNVSRSQGSSPVRLHIRKGLWYTIEDHRDKSLRAENGHMVLSLQTFRKVFFL